MNGRGCAHLKPLNINRQNGCEESMDQEPMRNEHNNCEDAKLADGPSSKESDDTEYGIVRNNFQCV